jgi:hypothetical protein
VSQDNIAAFLVERVAKYLACLLGVGSQLCHIAEGLNFFLTTTSSHSIKSTILTCVLRTAYNLHQHESTEFRYTVSYLLALLTCFRVGWYCKDPAFPKYWSAFLCKSNFWLHLYETAVHRADVGTHMGRMSRAGEEWRVEIVLRRATSRLRWYRLLRRNMLSSCSRNRFVC